MSLLGSWVKVPTMQGETLGVVEAIDENSKYNAWRKHPANYPVVVRLQKPYAVLGRKYTHMTFDWQGYATRWERFLGINKLELY